MKRFFINQRVAALAAVMLLVAGCGRGVQVDPAPQEQLALALRKAGGGGKSTAHAVVSTGTGWGTLKGVFHFAGGPPAGSFMSTAGKDTEVCGTQVPMQSLEVDSASKGIANIIVFARKVPRVYDAYKKAAGQKREFDQKKCMFLSHVFGCQTKDTVVIKNSDPVSHNTNLSPQGNPGINPVLLHNGEIDYKFVKQLNLPTEVTCNIHPWMKAYILARDDPYFAITGKDGSFEIANLPAGDEIEFQVWHEAAPGGGLEARGDWSKGRFRLKLTDGKTEDLKTIEVPAAAFR
ncbi:MAG TPA: hypothetical protein VG433_14430 [Pirellulales bacterium]|jgi:hypothetical protein|nr:hypothetical protein [Pirellulales bacterium]